MEWVRLAVTTALGSVVTWFVAHHYYLKTRADDTFRSSFIESVKQEASRAKRREARKAMQQGERTESNVDSPTPDAEAVYKLIVTMVEAWEDGEIYNPEVLMASRAFEKAGQMFETMHNAICEGASREPLPRTLTPKWHDRNFEAWVKHMQELKTTAQAELQKHNGP